MSDLRPKAYQGTAANDAPTKSALSMKSLKLSSEVVLKDGSLALTFMAISSWRVVFLKSCGTATRASTFECVERPSDVIAGTSPDSNVVDPPSMSADAGLTLPSMHTAAIVATAVLNTVVLRRVRISRWWCSSTVSPARASAAFIVTVSRPRGELVVSACLLPDAERCLTEIAGAKPRARGSNTKTADARRMAFEEVAGMENAGFMLQEGSSDRCKFAL